MKITDLFESLDKSWNLVTGNDVTNKIKNTILNNGHGRGGLQVYHKEHDPSQIIFKIYHNGAWEVHHSYYDGETYHSGERFKPQELGGLGSNTINTGFPATAAKIYKELLDSGNSIRVTAPKTEPIMDPITNKPQKTLWNAYEKFIKHQIARSDGKYMAGPINTNGVSIQNEPEISQVIRPYGKKWIEEMFNKHLH